MVEKLLEKEKLLVTSNFSISYSVFKRLVQQTYKNQGLFGKGLNNGLYSFVPSSVNSEWFQISLCFLVFRQFALIVSFEQILGGKKGVVM